MPALGRPLTAVIDRLHAAQFESQVSARAVRGATGSCRPEADTGETEFTAIKLTGRGPRGERLAAAFEHGRFSVWLSTIRNNESASVRHEAANKHGHSIETTTFPMTLPDSTNSCACATDASGRRAAMLCRSMSRRRQPSRNSLARCRSDELKL